MQGSTTQIKHQVNCMSVTDHRGGASILGLDHTTNLMTLPLFRTWPRESPSHIALHPASHLRITSAASTPTDSIVQNCAQFIGFGGALGVDDSGVRSQRVSVDPD